MRKSTNFFASRGDDGSGTKVALTLETNNTKNFIDYRRQTYPRCDG